MHAWGGRINMHRYFNFNFFHFAVSITWTMFVDFSQVISSFCWTPIADLMESMITRKLEPINYLMSVDSTMGVNIVLLYRYLHYVYCTMLVCMLSGGMFTFVLLLQQSSTVETK